MGNRRREEAETGIVVEDGVECMWVRLRITRDSNPELFVHLAAVGPRRRAERLKTMATAGLANLGMKTIRALLDLAAPGGANAKTADELATGVDSTTSGKTRFASALAGGALPQEHLLRESGGVGDAVDEEVGGDQAAVLRQRAKSRPARNW